MFKFVHCSRCGLHPSYLEQVWIISYSRDWIRDAHLKIRKFIRIVILVSRKELGPRKYEDFRSCLYLTGRDAQSAGFLPITTKLKVTGKLLPCLTVESSLFMIKTCIFCILLCLFKYRFSQCKQIILWR